jgi:putative acetyltransferase
MAGAGLASAHRVRVLSEDAWGPPAYPLATMLIRRERPGDERAIERVHAEAFDRAAQDVGTPPEFTLVENLRASEAWIAELSLVAVWSGEIIGHVLCSRALLAQEHPVLALAPIGVLPDRQGVGVGHALMHAVLGAADALDEALVGVLGEPGYYERFGFHAAAQVGIEAPDPAWGKYFQVRLLTGYKTALTGRFSYAEPFDGL